jgi:hypothetical protein
MIAGMVSSAEIRNTSTIPLVNVTCVSMGMFMPPTTNTVWTKDWCDQPLMPHSRIILKKKGFLPVNAEPIDNKPVVDKQLAPQAIASVHSYLRGNP